MKRIFLFLSVFLLITTTTSCHKVSDQIEKLEKQEPEYEKMEDPRQILDAIQEGIAKKVQDLEVADGVLSDKNTGFPYYEIIPLGTSQNHDKIAKHFNPEDIKSGYILRPIVTSDNAQLLIIVHAQDNEASENVKQAMAKVLSDQETQAAQTQIKNQHLIKSNGTIRQGNFLIYVTWEHTHDIIHIFEHHVR